MNTLRTRALPLTAVLVLLLGLAAQAHEGEHHRVMGTVSKVEPNRIEVKAPDGRTVAFNVTGHTRILQGTKPASAADIRVGTRVVVVGMDSGGEDALVAKEVRVGTRSPDEPEVRERRPD